MRLGVAATVLMLAMMCAAQGMPQASGPDAGPGTQAPAEGAQSDRIMFGGLCGIADPALQAAIRLSRSPEGEWRVVAAGKRPGASDNAAARVWRESNWMVDLHDVPGLTMHTGQMCFGASGQMTYLIDNYMDIPNCGCLRYTALRFDEVGKVVQQEQRFIRADTGAEIAAPEAAKGFPDVFGFRRVEQLPFYSLIKR